VNLDGLHVIGVDRDDGGGVLKVVVESEARVEGCRVCGVVASSAGRSRVELLDAPVFGLKARLVWHKRRWRCMEVGCPGGVFTEQDVRVAEPGARMTRRLVDWAVGQMRQENASVRGLCRQAGVSWRAMWTAVKARLVEMDNNPARFAGVQDLGVDEHVWHHVSEKKRGSKYFTGMVDLTRTADGKVHARLLDVSQGRSGKVYAQWLEDRGAEFRQDIKVAALDPFHGYKNAIDDQLQDAVAVLDAFHIVKLANQAVDEVRRRVQQDTLGHRGKKGDPLYGIRTILRCGAQRLTDKQKQRLAKAIEADERHEEVYVAYQCAQMIRDAYHQDSLTDGHAAASRLIDILPTCPIPEIRRLGKTLRQWKTAFLAYWKTHRSSNAGSEAMNNLIELARRIARGFRNPDNYRLRILLVTGALT